MNNQKLRLTELFEQLENAYKKYGNIAVAIRINSDTMVPVLQTGISSVAESRSESIDNFYFCFSPDVVQDGESTTSNS